MRPEGLLLKTVKKTTGHSLVYGIGMSFAAISSILLVPLYTRFLNPSDYGAYSLISIIFSLLCFLYDFGMINAIFRWYYQYDESESVLRKRVISTALVFLYCLAIFFTIILWFNARGLSMLMLREADFTWIIRLMLLGVLLQSFTWVPLSILRIHERVVAFTCITICGMILLISMNYLLLFLGRGLQGIYESYIITYLCIVGVLLLITRKHYAIDFSFGELKGMLGFGLPYLPVLFFSWMIDFSDRYLLGHLSTLQQVGLYSVGYKLGQVMYMVEKTFLVAWVPLMLSIYQRHKEEAPKVFGGVFTYFTLGIFFLSLSISIFSPEIIRFFTAPAYFEASRVVPWIALAYLLSGVYIYMLSGFIIAKNVYLQPMILLLSALVNIGLNLALIPKYGMMGSAYATVASYLMAACFTVFFSQRLYRITIEWLRVGKIAGCSMAIWIANSLIHTSGTVSAISFKLLLFVVFFCTLYISGFFNQEEIRRLKMIIAGRGLTGNA